MMKLLVMSDTHGDAEVIKNVCEANPHVDIVIHCGDSELPYDHPYLEGIIKVRGNCDHDDRFPLEEIFTIHEKNIFTAHGHLLNVKSNLMNLMYRAAEVSADVVFFGHSHLLGSELVENVLFVNPGSLLKPRGIKEKSYVIVTFESNIWTVTAYTNQGIEIYNKSYSLEDKR